LIIEGTWTRSICSREAALASTTSSPCQEFLSSSDSIARILPAFSGWLPVSCSKERGWRK